MVETGREYVGRELENFATVLNWKRYWSSMILPYLGKRVLEVGAGIGSSTSVLTSMGSAERWLCLEPDHENIGLLQKAKGEGSLPESCEIRQGTLAVLRPEEAFDSVLYIDVLEHIEDDKSEIKKAASHLAPGGHLIVLAPAYPFLFSEFDRAIGHHRRYTHSMFVESYGDSLLMTSVRYLDCMGLLLSLGNRVLLHSSHPSKRQLSFWDRFLVPISRRVDRIVNYRFGRSILLVYEKTHEQHGT